MWCHRGGSTVQIARQVAVHVAGAGNNALTLGVSRGEFTREDKAVVLVELVVGGNVAGRSTRTLGLTFAAEAGSAKAAVAIRSKPSQRMLPV